MCDHCHGNGFTEPFPTSGSILLFIKICCLAANVVSLSLPRNGIIRHNTIYRGLFNDTFNSSGYMASNEPWNGKDGEGNSRGWIWGAIRHLPGGTEENPRKIPYRQPLSVPSGAAQSRATVPTRRQERSAPAADGSSMPLHTTHNTFYNSHYSTKFLDLDGLRGCCYREAIFIIGRILGSRNVSGVKETL
jgi:hypothetical protein